LGSLWPPARRRHAAIAARSLGIPAAVGLTELATMLGAGDGPTAVALDGFSGELLIEPTADELAMIERRVALDADDGRRAAKLRGRGGAARDGRAVGAGNLGRPGEVERAGDGRGGCRPAADRFLFLGRAGPPAEDEQARAYQVSSPHSARIVRSLSDSPTSAATRESVTWACATGANPL
jgi:phosphotransferase system enzyme I (PtsI)